MDKADTGNQGYNGQDSEEFEQGKTGFASACPRPSRPRHLAVLRYHPSCRPLPTSRFQTDRSFQATDSGTAVPMGPWVHDLV